MNPRSSDTPFLANPDSLETQVIEHPFSFTASQSPELNALIVEAVNRMGGVGDKAEENYQKALKTIVQRGPEALEVLVAEYEQMPEDHYLDRWSLVHLISELRLPAAIQALNRIIGTRIPAEKMRDSHDNSTAAEELLIRTTAIEGVVRLSAGGLEEARAVLLKHAANRVFSIRRACVQGLMETGTDDDKKRLRRLLKERKEEALLKIRRANVREVQQPVGGRYVVPPQVKSEVPPPDIPARKE
jgi:hypothetical protein